MSDHCFVIPAYKNSAFLEKCIESLLQQSVKSDIIITTSTPTEFTKSIASKYNIPYHINNVENAGIACDWNFALSKATANLVTIAHQDDIYAEEFSKKAIEAYHQYADFQICFTNYADLFDQTIKSKSVYQLIKKLLLAPILISKESSNSFIKKWLIAFGNPISCPTVTFNKNKIGQFSFNRNYRFVVDWFAWLELSKQKGSFVYINQALIQHRIHEKSATTNEMKDGARTKEEKEILSIIWGKWLGSIIAFVYQLSHYQNKPTN
ncbi:MAG: glycosyltransferase family A protein [Sphingobacteriia bacterium]|jgi:glycosyltransferase involved in cell wall biosynthesis